ncbi:VOC family protein [Streptomyces sp. NPDC088197]|uniref:VOC family protein n=1 Tax=Streptomyces sp. NPDC088197 TaxID=3365840 RepID=UPI003815DAB1
MTILGISHIELYTQRASTNIAFLMSRLGFTRVADVVEVDGSSVLLRRGQAHVIVTSGWAAAQPARQPGPVVAGIALQCEDVHETASAAAACGAMVESGSRGQVIVRTGWIHHTLTLEGPEAALSLGQRNWIPHPHAVEQAAQAHIGRIELDLGGDEFDIYSALCEKAFTMTKIDSPINGYRRLRFYTSGADQIEFTVTDRRSSAAGSSSGVTGIYFLSGGTSPGIQEDSRQGLLFVSGSMVLAPTVSNCAAVLNSMQK